MGKFKLFKNTSIYTLGNLGRKTGQLLLLPLYTAYLSGAEFGIFALLVLISEFLTRLIQTPSGVGLLRFYYAPKHKNERDKLVYSLLFFSIALGLIFLIGFLYLNDIVVNLIQDDSNAIEDNTLLSLINLYSAVLILQPLSAFCLTFLRIREYAGYYAFVSILRIIGEIGIACLGLLLLDWGVFTLVYARLAGLFTISMLVLPNIFYSFKIRFSIKSLKEVLAYSLPLLPSAYSEILVKSGDRYLIKMLLSLSATGVYSVAYQVSGVIDFILSQPLDQAFQPMAMKLEDNPDKLRRFTQDALYGYAFIGGVLSLGVAVYSEDILKIFASSEEFQAGWVIIPIITLAFLIQGLSRFSGMGLIMEKRSWLQSLGMLIAAGFNIVFNFVLIPMFGIQGAAIATLLSYIFWNFWKAYFSFKYYNLYFNWIKVFLIIGIGIVIYILSLILFGDLPLYLSVVVNIFPVFCYVLIIWYSGLISKRLKDYIIELILKSRKKIYA